MKQFDGRDMTEKVPLRPVTHCQAVGRDLTQRTCKPLILKAQGSSKIKSKTKKIVFCDNDTILQWTYHLMENSSCLNANLYLILQVAQQKHEDNQKQCHIPYYCKCQKLVFIILNSGWHIAEPRTQVSHSRFILASAQSIPSQAQWSQFSNLLTDL